MQGQAHARDGGRTDGLSIWHESYSSGQISVIWVFKGKWLAFFWGRGGGKWELVATLPDEESMETKIEGEEVEDRV